MAKLQSGDWFEVHWDDGYPLDGTVRRYGIQQKVVRVVYRDPANGDPYLRGCRMAPRDYALWDVEGLLVRTVDWLHYPEALCDVDCILQQLFAEELI